MADVTYEAALEVKEARDLTQEIQRIRELLESVINENQDEFRVHITNRSI